jgi:hypothetical protein
MPDLHLSLLGLEFPNLLPKSVPWINFSDGSFSINSHSEWVRPAGRLIWSTLLFTIGIIIAFIWTTKPKPAEPATWSKTIVGAMAVWVMMTLGYGTIPHEWLTFGTSYLNFNSATFVIRRNSIIHFDIDRAAVVDIGGTIIYGIVLVLQVWLFIRWQKRPTIEAAAAKAAESEGEGAATGGGPLARLRRRREKRVSAYGRPVTTEAT